MEQQNRWDDSSENDDDKNTISAEAADMNLIQTYWKHNPNYNKSNLRQFKITHSFHAQNKNIVNIWFRISTHLKR